MKKLVYKISALVITGALLLCAYYTQIKHSDTSCNPCVLPQSVEQIAVVGNQDDTQQSLFPSAGWCSLDHECPATPLKIQGTIPSWLHGNLLRVGPGKFEMGASKCDYAFDGFAMLYSFTIDQNKIEFAHSYLQTGYYKKSVETGIIPSIAQKKPSLLSKLSALAKKPDPYDNNSVNIIKIGDTCTAMTLTLHSTKFDPMTLATCGPVACKGIDGHVTTPYPLYDRDTKLWYNVLIEYGGTSSTYKLYTTDQSLKRTVIASSKTKSPAYIHSIAMTKRYGIIPLIPFTVSPSDLLFSGKPFIENFVWQDNQPLQFMVIDKKSGAIVKTFNTAERCVFDQINAFEQGNTLILDMLECPKTELIDFMKLANVCNPDYKKPQFSLVRYTINLDQQSVQRKVLSDLSIQLPTINQDYRCRDYTYVYAASIDRSKLYKINVKTGSVVSCSVPGCFAGQPLFVARPGAQQEDDGVLLVVMLDASVQKSCLVIIDALTMKEKARAYVPYALPFDMGGYFDTLSRSA